MVEFRRRLDVVPTSSAHWDKVVNESLFILTIMFMLYKDRKESLKERCRPNLQKSSDD